MTRLRSIRLMRNYGRVRRWSGIVILLVLAVAALFYHLVTTPERIRRLCVRYLSRSLDGQVAVEQATFSLFDGIHLDGVRVTETDAAPADPSADRPFFSCRNLLLKHDPLALLLGRLVVKEVVAVNPVCNLVRSEETGEYNLSRIVRRPPLREPAARPILPVIRLRNAALTIARQHGGERRDVERIDLSVLATPVAGTAETYSVAWQRGGPEPAKGRSSFDLRALSFKNLDGGLPWLSLETGMLVAARQAPEAVRWFSLLGLAGRIKAEDYDLSFRSGGGAAGQLTLRLTDAALSIPGDEFEQTLSREERYLRFEGVEGLVQLAATRADLRFTGVFHGAPCRVSATLEGSLGPHAHLDDVGLSARITCEDLTLPAVGEEASPAANRFVQRWRTLRSFYNDFDPHGRVALEVTLTKAAGAGQPVRLERGMMTVLHADGSFRSFPYRVRNVTGSVEVTPEGIFLRQLAGDHDGAPVVVDGWLAEARWYAASRLHLTGQGVALDRELHDALNDRYQKLWDTFDLSGAADITVDMIRAPGTEESPQPWARIIRAELRDARARYTGFPYPLEGLSGGVTIAGDRLHVSRLIGRNGPGQVMVDGWAELAPRGLSDLDLRLQAEGLAFDDPFLAALPEEARDAVLRFAPRGTFDLDGDITFDASTGRATYDLTAALRDVRMTYRELPVPVEEVAGTIRLQPHQITIPRLVGRRGQAVVTMSGTFDTGAEPRDAHALVTCADLVADEELLAALPQDVGGFCRDLRLTGPVRTVTRYEKPGPTDTANAGWRTTIDAAGAAVNPLSFPYPLTITGGTATIETGRLTLDHLEARHGDTILSLDGMAAWDGPAVQGTFTLSGKRVVLDEDLRLAVPWRWRRAWNKLSPRGAVDLELEHLHYHRAREAASADWDFDGRLALNDVGLDVGVRVTDLVGVLQGSGHVSGASAGLSTSAELALDSVTINDRRVENIRGRLENSAADGRLALGDVSGTLYGGPLSADVQVRFGSDATRYDVSATMQDVDLHEFLRAGERSATRYASISGTLDARIFLNGSEGDPGSRQGGGRVHVRDGSLYRLPLLLAILDGINFTVPQEPALQEMSAEFFVTGQRVELQEIVFQGSALTLVGSGTLIPGTGNLALKLVAATPRRWGRVPVLTEFLEGAARELMEVDVHGPLSDPVITAKPLRGVEAAAQTLFEKKKPKKPKPIAPKKPAG